jgi:hypothetical protein
VDTPQWPNAMFATTQHCPNAAPKTQATGVAKPGLWSTPLVQGASPWRRMLTSGVIGVAAATLVGCGGATRSTAATSTSACETGQLQGELNGIGNATGIGHWTADFVIADSSSTPCLLEPPAVLDFLDDTGSVRASASSSHFSAVRLTAKTELPPAPTNGVIGSVGIEWPSTPPDVNFSEPYTPGPCPKAVFVPAALRITFGRRGKVTIKTLTGKGNTDGPGVAFCNTSILVFVGKVA